MTKRKKILLRIALAILIVFVLTIICISPITKYLIEKYSEQYTGRKITMDWVYVNLFTGTIHFNDLQIRESKSDSIFFSTNGIDADLAMMKLFKGTYELTHLTLDHPKGTIIQNNKNFNFDDLIENFTTNDSIVEITKELTHLNILDIKIIDGYFTYIEEIIPVNYSIKEVNIECTGYRWDVDTIAATYSLLPAIGPGELEGESMLNIKNRDYRIGTRMTAFDMQLIEQYLKDLSNFGTFSAILDADIYAFGNLKNAENITASGSLALSDFHFGKSKAEDYASFDRLELVINELSPINHKYLFDSLWLNEPYIKYERYDSLDNIQAIFGKGGSNIASTQSNSQSSNLILEIADYVKELAKNFFQSVYQLNTLKIEKANIVYSDFTQRESFSMELDHFAFDADSIDKTHGWVDFTMRSKIKPYGDLVVKMDINPKDSSDFKLNYHFDEIPITMFNPYVISQSSYHLDRGSIELKGTWIVRNGVIQSDNHLLVIDPRVTRKSRSKDANWVPIPLVFAFIRERGNVIDYEIPITGDLKDPKFHLRDVIFDVLSNIFIKPPTTPYRLTVKNVEKEIEESLELKWPMNKTSLLPVQKRFIQKIADHIAKNPDVTITVTPELNIEKEKEYILIYEAKKKYYSATSGMNKGDSDEDDVNAIDNISMKDPAFIKYIDKLVKDSLLFTMQSKFEKIISKETVQKKLDQLMKEREQMFLAEFNDAGISGHVILKKESKKTPFNWFSLYRIQYNGKLPDDLIEANQKMNELNDKAPRKEFREARRRNRKTNPTTK